MLQWPDLSGRLTKWAVELGEFDITYRGRQTIKSHALADFVADFSAGANPEENICSEVEKVGTWKTYVDGARNHEGVRLGLAIISPYGDVAYRSVRCEFPQQIIWQNTKRLC